MPRDTLILVHEPEQACAARLRARGFSDRSVLEISSYLAQSTDLAPDFGLIEAACARRGLAFEPVELDRASAGLSGRDPARTLVWTLTDGVAYYRGGASPALARLNGLPIFGSDDALFALCQDKFRAGAVLGALGLPVPQAGLARDGAWLVEPPASPAGWFVKPNRLGSKVGIWPDSRVDRVEDALALSRRIAAAYRDDALVQPYVAGRNARASFLAVEAGAGGADLGIALVDSGSDFQTMAESLALYGETGAEARRRGDYREPALDALDDVQPLAASAIRSAAGRVMRGLALRDVFSLDFRVDADDRVTLIEFEVCPGLPCFDFRAYCRSRWGLDLADAMARAAASRLGGKAG